MWDLFNSASSARSQTRRALAWSRSQACSCPVVGELAPLKSLVVVSTRVSGLAGGGVSFVHVALGFAQHVGQLFDAVGRDALVDAAALGFVMSARIARIV